MRVSLADGFGGCGRIERICGVRRPGYGESGGSCLPAAGLAGWKSVAVGTPGLRLGDRYGRKRERRRLSVVSRERERATCGGHDSDSDGARVTGGEKRQRLSMGADGVLELPGS